MTTLQGYHGDITIIDGKAYRVVDENTFRLRRETGEPNRHQRRKAEAVARRSINTPKN